MSGRHKHFDHGQPRDSHGRYTKLNVPFTTSKPTFWRALWIRITHKR